MTKHKQNLAVTEAARQAGVQLATWSAVETMAKKVNEAAERRAESNTFAEFLLSGTGSKAIVRIGDSVFRIEG
jgi:hypothetical protein